MGIGACASSSSCDIVEPALAAGRCPGEANEIKAARCSPWSRRRDHGCGEPLDMVQTRPSRHGRRPRGQPDDRRYVDLTAATCTFRLYYHAGLHSVTKNEHLAVVDAVARQDPPPRKRGVPTAWQRWSGWRRVSSAGARPRKPGSERRQEWGDVGRFRPRVVRCGLLPRVPTV
jgi:hypothetical protein